MTKIMFELDLKEIIGMRAEEAKDFLFKKGIKFRIVEEDGESFVVTCDWKPRRVNLRISEGVIESYYIG